MRFISLLILPLALLPTACAHTHHHSSHETEMVRVEEAAEPENAEAPEVALPVPFPTAAAARIPKYSPACFSLPLR